ISSTGSQNFTIQGVSSANALTVGSASSANGSSVGGINQNLVVGHPGQSGSITVFGGNTAGKSSSIFSNSDTQFVSTSGTITLTGGTANGTAATCNVSLGAGSCATIASSGTGMQTVAANALHMQGGSAGTGNSGNI